MSSDQAETIIECILTAKATQRKNMAWDYDTGGDIIAALELLLLERVDGKTTDI